MRHDSSAGRVVVTGIGLVTPLGDTIQDFWQKITQGESGIKEISLFDTAEFSTHLGGEISSFSGEKYRKRELANLGRTSLLGLTAAESCLKDSGLELKD